MYGAGELERGGWRDERGFSYRRGGLKLEVGGTGGGGSDASLQDFREWSAWGLNEGSETTYISFEAHLARVSAPAVGLEERREGQLKMRKQVARYHRLVH